MDNCNYAQSLIRAMQAVANQASDYAANDGWRNIQSQVPTTSGVNVGLIFVLMIVAVMFLSRRPKKHTSQTS